MLMLMGDTEPVNDLLSHLQQSGVDVRLFPGKISPVTKEGGECATADLHPDHAEIYYPIGSPTHWLYHELLHIERACILGSEVFHAHDTASDTTKKNLQEINNNIDHAFVIPKEIAVYPEAVQYWHNDFYRALKNIDWSTSPKGICSQKVNLLQSWLVLPHIPGLIDLADVFCKELQERGWLDTANRMTHSVQAAGVDKRAAVEAFKIACAESPTIMGYTLSYAAFQSYKLPNLRTN